jgi:signal transduction histidine kinase
MHPTRRVLYNYLFDPVFPRRRAGTVIRTGIAAGMFQKISTSDRLVDIDEYLDSLRLRVTRNFCMFCFVLSILAVFPSYFARVPLTLVINTACMVCYAIPLLLVLRTREYRFAAKIFVCIAVLVTLLNAIVTNCDFSPPTVVWYFVYLVFAHLVLNITWATCVAGVGFISVTTFTVFRLLHLTKENSHLVQDSIIVGSPIALGVAMVALLYLLIIYKRLRDVMLRKIVESNREKAQLMRVVSHDMRNYLGAILGMCDVIKDDIERGTTHTVAELREYLGMIERSASGGISLTEEVALIARELPERQYLEHLELVELITPIANRYQVLGRSKGVAFHISAGSQKINVAVDRDKLSRVVENLLSNALKFSRRGGIVTISAVRQGRHAVVSVADTGIGIPASIREKVFEPFSSAGRPGTDNEKSVGLGLSIVKKLVEAHGGSIRLESEEGRGTTFYVELPALESSSPPVQPAS